MSGLNLNVIDKLIGKLRYIEIIKEIDSGGTSKIYLGVNTHTGFRVAVKELDPKFFQDDNIKKLFIAEANRYLYLDHANIVKLVDLFLLDQEDTGYLIMEYVDGMNLKKYVQTYGPLPFANAALFVVEALKAIAFAHRKNVVHNDIKPSNIMITNPSGQYSSEIKVIDFGISMDLNARVNGQKMFTWYYASPEQITTGMVVDHRTDIYSMGITLYELVCGKAPLANKGYNESQLFHKIKTENTPPVVSLNEYDIPFKNKLNQIIGRATMKDRDNRYQTCEEFIGDLYEILN